MTSYRLTRRGAMLKRLAVFALVYGSSAAVMALAAIALAMYLTSPTISTP